MSGSNTVFYRGENPLRADKLNQAINERISRSGDTMQGMLTLWRDPVGPFDAVTLQYLNTILSGIGSGSGGIYLPLAGGTMAGPINSLAGPSINLTSTGFILTGPNGLGISGNYQGSGFPAFQNTKRMIFVNSAPAAGDYCDFQFQRSTSFTGGAGNISACMRVLGVYGANDASENWNLVSQAQAHGSGVTVGLFSTGQRLVGANAGIFGAVINAADQTGLPSASGSEVVGLEVDCAVQDRDTGGNSSMYGGVGNRISLNVVAVRGSATTSPPTEVAAGAWFTTARAGVLGTDQYTNFLSAIGFGVNTQAYQALDTRGAIVPTGVSDPFAAVRMQHDQIIDFNGGTTLKSVAGNYLQYRTATGRLYYVVGGVDQWSVDASGNVRARGTFTPSTTP